MTMSFDTISYPRANLLCVPRTSFVSRSQPIDVILSVVAVFHTPVPAYTC